MVESSSLEIFKLQLDSVPDNLKQASLPMKGWTRYSFEVTSNLGCSMILRLSKTSEKYKLTLKKTPKTVQNAYSKPSQLPSLRRQDLIGS